MLPTIETLERRDVPGLTYGLVHPYGAAADYPIAPAGQQVVALQDLFNVISPFAQFHPTPLMPVPPATYNLGVDCSVLTESLNEWSVPQPGGDAYGYLATADWLAVQGEMYSFETSDSFWLGWLAQVQSGVAAANAELFAEQDAYWSSQSPVPESPIQEPLANSLIVDALLALEKSR